MRILFVSNLYPPNVVGGYERLCHEVASAMVERGHEVTVLTSSYGGRSCDYPGQTIFRSLELLADSASIYQPFAGDAATREAVNGRNVAAVRRVVEASAPDVIFAWNLFFLDRSVLTELTGTGRRVVVMLTDNWLLAALDAPLVSQFFQDHVFGGLTFPPAHLRGWRRLLGRWSRPSTPRFSLPCDAVFGARFMRDFYEAGGVAFRGSRVIHNGVRLQDFPTVRFADRSRTQDERELRLLFAGRVVDLKGVHTAIEALAHLPVESGRPRATLTIVGDRQDRAYDARLQELIGRLGCSDRVTFLPPVSEGELFDLFQGFDAYLFPSLYEPFSLTLIHALAAGIPTVAAMAGGNGEIVSHGRSGLLFRKGDPLDLARAVTRLRDRPRLRQRLSLGARRVARHFTFDRMADGMERYLREGVEGTRSGLRPPDGPVAP
jgi:glycosyltransferase involved in cell wall biosynthesis